MFKKIFLGIVCCVMVGLQSGCTLGSYRINRGKLTNLCRDLPLDQASIIDGVGDVHIIKVDGKKGDSNEIYVVAPGTHTVEYKYDRNVFTYPNPA